MMERAARLIIRRRVFFLILYIILIPACFMMFRWVHINFDFTRYLSEATMTKRSLTLMEKEFGKSGQLRIMFKNLPDADLSSALDTLNAMEEVTLAAHDEETGDQTVSGTTYRLVTVMLRDTDEMGTAQKLMTAFPNAVMAGSDVDTWQLNKSISEEITVALAIAVAVVLLILFLTSHAYFEPFLILLVLAVSIVVNMGTNWIFGTISFVTYAVCAILQLALAMDYAIFLLHSYNRFRDGGMQDAQAVAAAMKQSFMPIVSSAFTTVAGMLALLFMSFTIGFDIGIVLAKGIIISMLTVFTLMPALILLFKGALVKTKHKPLPIGGKYLAAFVSRGRLWLPLLLVPVILVSFALQTRNTYLFTDSGMNPNSAKIDAVFGSGNKLAILVPSDGSDEAYERQTTLVEKIRAVDVYGQPAVTDIQAMVTTGQEALKYYTPEDVASLLNVNSTLASLFFRVNGLGDKARADRLIGLASGVMQDNAELAQLQNSLALLNGAFNGPDYARMIVTMDVPVGGDASDRAVEGLLSASEAVYGQDFGIVGMAMSAYDIGNAFQGDLLRVSLITLAAILIIVAVSFRSLLTSLLLTAVIQGAIFINMAISKAAGQPIFFVSYLICMAIQMGATIDYAILLTNNYRWHQADLSPKESLGAALIQSLPTILTSGSIMTAAGYIIGRVSTVYYISSIGLLLARGAAISVVMVLTLLPALLFSLDKVVTKGVGPGKG